MLKITDSERSSRILKIVEKLSSGEYKKYGNEYRLRCPYSNDPNKHRSGDSVPSFFVNRETGFYHCFACEIKGHYKQLLKLVNESYYPEIEEVDEIVNNYKLKKNKTEKEIIPKIDLPPDCKSAYDIVNKKYISTSEYLTKERKIPLWLIRELDFKVCHYFGILYKSIVYPINYKNYSFWGARITNKKYIKDTKYFYPKGSPKERVLYGSDFWDNSDYLIIVEGIFDYCRLRTYGYNNVIPLFGKNLSIEFQVNDLLDKNIRKLYIMLDANEIKSMLALAKPLVRLFDIKIVEIKSKDPDLASESEIDNAIQFSKSYYDYI